MQEKQEREEKSENIMRRLKISKITLNFGAGKNPQILEKGMLLLKKISGKDPIQTKTQKRIPNWGLRPGLPIGAKITIRGTKAYDIIKKVLTAKNNTLSKRNFDNNGNVSFGIPEYIEISGLKYDPEIGIIGFEISISIERAGFRIKKRRLERRKIPKKHKISQEESMEFMKQKFGVTIQ